MGKAGGPNLRCHSNEVVLKLEKANNGEDVEEETGHSYTPTFVCPFKRIALVQVSSQEKKNV